MTAAIDARTVALLLGRTGKDEAAPRTTMPGVHFHVAGALGPAFVARSAGGNATLLVPLADPPRAAARRAAGLVLAPSTAVEFTHAGRTWTQPAAVLECVDPAVEAAFAGLVADVARRLPADPGHVTWAGVLGLVDEWQSMLASRAPLSAERELGLWAELWLIAECDDADRMVAAWRGPEGAPIDFLVAGVGAEVKASRLRHVHHVALSQVGTPLGDLDAYLLSTWIGVDPELGRTLPELVSAILARVSDPAHVLRTVAKLGFAPTDGSRYSTRFLPLETPWWIASGRVPTVGTPGRGVSQVRYVATLDEELRVDEQTAERLWTHFTGHAPRTRNLVTS